MPDTIYDVPGIVLVFDLRKQKFRAIKDMLQVPWLV